PNASDNGMFRFGFLTSPAVKVMLFQASAENREFVCATQIPTNNPNVVIAVNELPAGPTFSSVPRIFHKSPKFTFAIIPDFHPRKIPKTTSRRSDPVFEIVKTF